MTTLEKLKFITANTKAGFSLEINKHKGYYEKIDAVVAEYVEEGSLEQSVGDEIIKLDNLVDLQCYKDTPIGFYRVIHYDLDEAINKMYEAYKEHL